MPCLYSYLWRRMTELLACSLTVIVVMFFMSTLVTERVTATRDNPWLSGSYYPQWSQVSATEVIDFIYNAGLTSEQNGALLASTMNGLTPGQELRIGPGTYSINMWYSLEIQGTEINPIRITAMDFNDKPIFTRPNANQNVINIGVNSTTEYVAFIGIEITGGDTLMKIYNASNFWVDQCTIHDGDGVGIAANSQDTSYLYITRNHIYHPGTSDDTGEGMYLGANNSASVMTHSVIALNHVHDTGGTQGDGIEVKQGSYDNWIVENHVHDCNYPCILAYGTDGNGINVIERNVVYSSNDNAMQVQGEAIVRNNLIMDAAGAAFSSHDHQGQTLNLTFVHNTVINSGRASNLSSWNGRVGMVYANNVVYSQNAESIRFPNGSTDVMIAGNVVLGSVSGASTGYVFGNGLNDFLDITWDASSRNGTPSESSPIRGQGDPVYSVVEDIFGNVRSAPLDSGAFDADINALPSLSLLGLTWLILVFGFILKSRHK